MTRGAVIYRIHEFATLAGVTVRALHHYDRLGLLRPSGRSRAGYRLYSDRDLLRLEQIVVLKSLALPLKEIGRLLKRQSPLADVLKRQQLALAERREQLDAAILAIERAERSLASTHEPDLTLFVHIVREIETQNKTEWSKKYYSSKARTQVEKRKKLWNAKLQEQVTEEWAALIADVRAAVDKHESPTGARGQALATRWRSLVERFTGGDPDIQNDLNKAWQDRQNWPSEARRNVQVNPRIQAFIVKAMQGG